MEKTMPLDMDFVRAQFPGLNNGWTFFDNAGGSQILGRVVGRIGEYLIDHNVQLGGSYDVSVRAGEAVEGGRDHMKTLVNAARPEEIVLGSSSTVLIQNLARAMTGQLAAGDEIVVTNCDHESNIGPWMALEKHGVRIKIWRINPETFELDLDDLEALMSERTRLVCFAHVSNILGTVNPVAAITRLVHRHGARVCVDGVAYAPHRAIDVTAWDVDFYVFSLYKVYGPHYAVLYGKHALLLELDNLYHYFFEREKVPGKLEPGGVNFELVHGSGGIVEYLCELGKGGDARRKIVTAFDRIADHERRIGERLLEYLRGRNDCRIIGRAHGDDVARVPTVAFVIEGRDPDQVARLVDPHRIAVRFGDFYARRLIEDLGLAERNGVLRVSMVHYNTLGEVDALVDVLDRILSG